MGDKLRKYEALTYVLGHNMKKQKTKTKIPTYDKGEFEMFISNIVLHCSIAILFCNKNKIKLAMRLTAESEF